MQSSNRWTIKMEFGIFLLFFFSGRACLLLFACVFLSFYRCVFNYYSSLSRCCCCSFVDVFLLMYCYYSLVANSMLICENINNKTDISIFDRKLCGFIFRLKFVSNFKFSYECVFFVRSEQARVTEIETECLIHGCIICVKRTFQAMLLECGIDNQAITLTIF